MSNNSQQKTTARKEGRGELKREEGFKEKVVGSRADAERDQGNERKWSREWSDYVWWERDGRKPKSTISGEWEFLYAPRLKALRVDPSLSCGSRRETDLQSNDIKSYRRDLGTCEDRSKRVCGEGQIKDALKKHGNCPLQALRDDWSQFQSGIQTHIASGHFWPWLQSQLHKVMPSASQTEDP